MSIKVENYGNTIREESYKTRSDLMQPVADSASSIEFLDVFKEEYENDVDLPASATASGSTNDIFENPSAGDSQYEVKVPQVGAKKPSMQNAYFNIRMKNIDDGNYPLRDEDVTSEGEQLSTWKAINAFNLIEQPRGASIFQPEDFLYLKHYDQVPLNRLITLRRFAHPVFDDIFGKWGATEPDISRLLTYSTSDENQLSEILKFTAGLRWKPMSSESEKGEMSGTDDQSGISGIAGGVMRFIDPKYGQESMMGSARVNYDPQHDQNRVYGPVDSIADTHIRNVGVDFEQSMNLKFTFEMKSHNGINQKAAFMDLLSNIIMMITNDAKFWGGARYWVGPKPSSYLGMLKKFDSRDWREFQGKAVQGVKEAVKHFSKPENAKAMLQNIFNNAMNMAVGKLLNILGRTGIPVMNSLLSGNPVGPWHITVGNPLNPILVAGDLIIDNAEVSFSDELGFDDFPTEIILTITIKHAKPKGRAEIENMFNCGKGRIYIKPKDVFRRGRLGIPADGVVTLGNALAVASSKFGEFDKNAIKRNQTAVWSFLGDK